MKTKKPQLDLFAWQRPADKHVRRGKRISLRKLTYTWAGCEWDVEDDDNRWLHITHTTDSGSLAVTPEPQPPGLTASDRAKETPQ